MIGYRYKAFCSNVVDGDTIDASVDLGFNTFLKLRFRLARINAPELTSPDAKTRDKAVIAKNYVSVSILNKPIEIVSFKTEKFGRYLAEVFYERAPGEMINLNDELLKEGLADKYL